GIVFCI
ncbi:hypothetical protein D039_3938B, partial [Vibrio parahaemolyticus EKP-028]